MRKAVIPAFAGMTAFRIVSFDGFLTILLRLVQLWLFIIQTSKTGFSKTVFSGKLPPPDSSLFFLPDGALFPSLRANEEVQC